MVYRLINLPANVVGFGAAWQLTEKDFQEVVIPTIKNSNQNKFLLVLDN